MRRDFLLGVNLNAHAFHLLSCWCLGDISAGGRVKQIGTALEGNYYGTPPTRSGEHEWQRW